MGVEARRGDAVIGRGQLTAMAGEADLIAFGPAMGDQRLDQPAVARIHVAVEEGPDMVAAERIAAFPQPDEDMGRAHGTSEERCVGKVGARTGILRGWT